MLKLLKTINTLEDLKRLDKSELKILAKEIRYFFIKSLSKTGGHLASNLGVVELTIALHYIFNSPEDKVIWDVGHQSYVHKILTGRRELFKSLRQIDGMSGFPKRKESIHDIFETGHSSTSISAALGIAKARDLRGDKNHVIAVIGDGALTGGMAFEALNNLGKENTNLIIVLNDNEMSISKNVGAIGKYLNKLRSSKDYIKVKQGVEGTLKQVPAVGEYMIMGLKRTKDSLKRVLIQNTLFEQMGVKYLGPIDGHSFDELLDVFDAARGIEGPVLIHVNTKKGKGYKVAEEDPSKYHGITPFDIETGEILRKPGEITFSEAFAKAMLAMGKENDKVIGITAAMTEGTGLLPFARAFPKRFFDVGIAEQHAVTFAAGLASSGYKPVVAIYSSFIQRAYDQILHDVCLQKLPVVFAIDRAGIVGEDGSTHQGIFDVSFLSAMPHIKILSPKMPEEIESCMRYALEQDVPVAIRYPRGSVTIDPKYQLDYLDCCYKFLNKGNSIVILTYGRFVKTALDVMELFKTQGISISVVEAPCVHPIDYKALDSILIGHDYVFVLEDSIVRGGLGEKVLSYLASTPYKANGYIFGYQDGIIHHGKVEILIERCGLDKEGIYNKIRCITNLP